MIVFVIICMAAERCRLGLLIMRRVVRESREGGKVKWLFITMEMKSHETVNKTVLIYNSNLS
jgi:hypothetical protein